MTNQTKLIDQYVDEFKRHCKVANQEATPAQVMWVHTLLTSYAQEIEMEITSRCHEGGFRSALVGVRSFINDKLDTND